MQRRAGQLRIVKREKCLEIVDYFVWQSPLAIFVSMGGGRLNGILANSLS